MSHSVFEISDGRRIKIVLPHKQEERLSKTCFRGPDVNAAGNFLRWRSFMSLLHDKEFMPYLLDIIRDILEEHREEVAAWDRTDSGFWEYVTVPFGQPVGWTGTLPEGEELLIGAATKRRPLNGIATASFVDDPKFHAPKTDIVSFTCVFRPDSTGQADVACLVMTMYPGPHVGEVKGNMTERTGNVWFDFRHPGGNKFIAIDP